MDQEFTRKPGNVAISNLGFEVAVNTGIDVGVEYKEQGKVTSITAERATSGGIGLFMNWAKFPEATTTAEKREIFERVVRALRFMEIPISWTEIDPEQKTWPLPPRVS